MKTYICVFEPTPEARTDGAVPLTIALNAANEKIATASALIKLSEAYPLDMDKFNTDTPLCCVDQVGSPRPALGKFDEEFALENEFNGTCWDPIKPEEFSKIAPVIRIAAILLYGKTSFSRSEISKTVSFVNESSEQPKIRNIAKGLANINALHSMNEAQTAEIAEALFEFADENVSVIDAIGLGNNWLVEEPKSIQAEEPVIKRTYATLDTEVALAMLPDFDPNNILSAHVKSAKVLIERDDLAWTRWSMDLRTYPAILEIPREQIFALIVEANKQPALLNDANARKAFIDSHLNGKPTEIKSLGNGRFAIDGLNAQPANDTQVEEKPKRTRKKKETPAKTEQVPVKEIAVETKSEPEPVNIASIEPISVQQQDDFQQRAAVLEEVLNHGDNDNLSIWKRVQRTDSRFTKPLESMGFIGTSINSTYMFMRATEIFGPIGEGWGYEVIEEKFIDGKPLTEPVLDERNKQVATRYLRDGEGSLFCEQNHSLKIKFWYIIECETRGEFESYGATPYRYQTNYGIKVDGEVIKKSLTDAIKKALSMLGFSSDVYMGMHDNAEYIISNKLEFEIKAASEKAEDVSRIRKELDEKFTRHTETMRAAVTANELRGIASTLTREISTHAKLAKERGDSEYEKYLSGRLRRLNEIEKECAEQLNQKEEAIS